MGRGSTLEYYNWDLCTSLIEHYYDIYDDFKKIVKKTVDQETVPYPVTLFINSYKIENERLYPIEEHVVYFTTDVIKNTPIDMYKQCYKKLSDLGYSDHIKMAVYSQLYKMSIYSYENPFFYEHYNGNLFKDKYESKLCVFIGVFRSAAAVAAPLSL